jgi:mediator of RNA polymerase II transcription subunit 5
MTILRITPILVSEAMRAVIMSKMDKTALDGGVSYFLEPLLNWTLVGVIKATLYQYQKSKYVLTCLTSYFR